MQDLGHSFHSPKYELTISHGDPIHGPGSFLKSSSFAQLPLRGNPFSEISLFEKLFFRPIAPSGGIHFQKSDFLKSSSSVQLPLRGDFWHGRRLGVKMMQNHRVFLSKVARPTISRERGEGDPHDLRSLCRKVGRGSATDLVPSHRDLTLDRENPYSRELFGELSMNSIFF